MHFLPCNYRVSTRQRLAFNFLSFKRLSHSLYLSGRRLRLSRRVLKTFWSALTRSLSKVRTTCSFLSPCLGIRNLD